MRRAIQHPRRLLRRQARRQPPQQRQKPMLLKLLNAASVARRLRPLIGSGGRNDFVGLSHLVLTPDATEFRHRYARPGYRSIPAARFVTMKTKLVRPLLQPG